jgi:hypothetical protein
VPAVNFWGAPRWRPVQRTLWTVPWKIVRLGTAVPAVSRSPTASIWARARSWSSPTDQRSVSITVRHSSTVIGVDPRADQASRRVRPSRRWLTIGSAACGSAYQPITMYESTAASSK